jgi:hypothetical protein
MQKTIESILAKYGKLIEENIKTTLADENKVVTGRTRDSVNFEVDTNTLTINGAEHLTVLDSEEGRGPSESSSGDGFFEQIQEWASLRGIPEEFHKIIYININREGWKSEGLNHLIEDGILDLIDQMYEEMEKEIDVFLSLEIESAFQIEE